MAGALWLYCQQAAGACSSKDKQMKMIQEELDALRVFETRNGAKIGTDVAIIFYDCLQRDLSAPQARALIASQLTRLGKEYSNLPSVSAISIMPQTTLFACRILLTKKYFASISKFKADAAGAGSVLQHRGNVVEYSDGGQRTGKKFHAQSFSVTGPDVNAQLLPAQCARVHAGTAVEMTECTNSTLDMMHQTAQRLQLGSVQEMRVVYAASSILAGVGDRASNQSCHGKQMQKQIEAEMKELPEWDKMTEAEQADVTTFVTGSCGVHAVCNISVAMDRELDRCECMLAPISDVQIQAIPQHQLDELLSSSDTDDDVTLSSNNGGAAADASAHLITRFHFTDLNLLLESRSIPDFCKNHNLNDCWDAADTIEGLCCDLDLVTNCAKLEAMVKAKNRTFEDIISEAIMKLAQEAGPNAWGRARSRGQCSAEKLIYECNKCFTQMTE